MKQLFLTLALLLAGVSLVSAQFGYTFPSLDALLATSDLVVTGKVTKWKEHQVTEHGPWFDVTLAVEETVAGGAQRLLTFTVRIDRKKEEWDQVVAEGKPYLWFFVKSKRKLQGENPSEAKARARHPFKPTNYWRRIALAPAPRDERNTGALTAVLTMDFDLLEKPEEIIQAAKRIAAAQHAGTHPPLHSVSVPRMVAQRTGTSGDGNAFVVPGDARLETLGQLLLRSPEKALPDEENQPDLTEDERERRRNWREYMINLLREEGIKALREFKSDQNIALLKPYLDHPAQAGQYGLEEKHYYLRAEAYEVLQAWRIPVGKPVLVTGRDARKPQSEDDLRTWLENMIWHHNFGLNEITAATGLEGEAIEAAQKRFHIYRREGPKRAADAPLLVLPYPGGRHPRIGFLDGAIKPQRETKFSVFTPWDEGSYVVVDVPEAIWSNLGLTYLAHTHVPTVWTKQNIEMEKLEWKRGEDGTLEMHRKLPNGIEFGTEVRSSRDSVTMDLWLKNGTDNPLTDLRIQNCVMLKSAHGFEDQSSENKVIRKPYIAVHDRDKKRWIITAWSHCHRPWANDKCPCMHSDPKFPDCAPGETQRVRGWLSFYKGEDLDGELERIEKTGWRKE